MIWEQMTSPDRRRKLSRAVQTTAAVLALIALILYTRNRAPELALTFYFLCAGPVIVSTYYWGRRVGLALVLGLLFFAA